MKPNPVKKSKKHKCNCHLYERQVCDICQGWTGNEVDADTPKSVKAWGYTDKETGRPYPMSFENKSEAISRRLTMGGYTLFKVSRVLITELPLKSVVKKGKV